MNAPFPPFQSGNTNSARSHDIEPELLRPMPRSVALRSSAIVESVYSLGCGSALLLMGLLNVIHLVYPLTGKRGVTGPGDVPVGIFTALFFGVPGTLMVVGLVWNLISERRLVERGQLRRARVEDIEVVTGKNARQTITLSWQESDGQARRETVTWRGSTTLLPEQTPAFERGELVSVLVDNARPDQFVVYRFSLFHAR